MDHTGSLREDPFCPLYCCIASAQDVLNERTCEGPDTLMLCACVCTPVCSWHVCLMATGWYTSWFLCCVQRAIGNEPLPPGQPLGQPHSLH